MKTGFKKSDPVKVKNNIDKFNQQTLKNPK